MEMTSDSTPGTALVYYANVKDALSISKKFLLVLILFVLLGGKNISKPEVANLLMQKAKFLLDEGPAAAAYFLLWSK